MIERLKSILNNEVLACIHIRSVLVASGEMLIASTSLYPQSLCKRNTQNVKIIAFQFTSAEKTFLPTLQKPPADSEQWIDQATRSGSTFYFPRANPPPGPVPPNVAAYIKSLEINLP